MSIPAKVSQRLGICLSMVLVCLALSGCSEKFPDTLDSLFFGSPTASGPLAPEVPVYLAPANRSSNQPTSVTLQWNCTDGDSEFLQFYLYLGDDGYAYLFDTVTNVQSYQLTGLAPSTTYWWAVTARDESYHTTEGPVWSFTTGDGSVANQAPNDPINPVPSDSAESTPVDLQLSWSCTDPEFDPLQYDLYFGTSSSPQRVAQNLLLTSYNPGPLESLTDYYWYVVASDDEGNSTTGPTWTFRTTIGGTILFSSNRNGQYDLFRMNADGTDQQLLYSRGSDIFDATWSPDGTRIAFTSFADSSHEIFTVRADGLDVRQLTDNGQNDGGPRWSPDGGKILFHRYLGSYNNQIFVINADGTGESNLSNNSSNDSNPSWSPDGSTIAYNRSFGNVWLMNANGQNQRAIESLASYDYYDPTWSPDGSRLLFYREYSGNYDIVLLDPDGTNPTRLTIDAAQDTWPCWSPAGDFIVWVSYRDAPREIFVMKSDGSSKRKVSASPSYLDIQPSWKR